MKLAKLKLPDGTHRVGIVDGEVVRLLDLHQVENVHSLQDLLNSRDPAGLASSLVDATARPLLISDVRFVAPIDRQEVWAAGVTYQRSQIARMEESESGASHYDKVYSAARPELFFKATASRVSGPGEPVRVRADSNWSVPEPELALVLNRDMQIVGYTIGNDMSARDIEGENPLYLPQAKVYRQCCGLGPVVLLATKSLDLAATGVRVFISRDAKEIFCGETSLAQLNRKLSELADWLAKENEFPEGAFLLTGTGIIPPDDFTLENGDSVAISIDGVGTLINPVVKD